MTTPLHLSFPFRGWWRARNSPASKVPSHGTHLFGTTYSIDFIGVTPHGHTAPRGWRSLFATEDPEHFPSFGRILLAPVAGTVVQAWDDLPDHVARRSQLHLLAYMARQGSRVRRGGVRGLTGNAVVIRSGQTGPYVALCHLQQDSLRVKVGERVNAGDELAACGNSGNSTQPHVHLQVIDSTNWEHCTGLPMVFSSPNVAEPWVPANEDVFHVP